MAKELEILKHPHPTLRKKSEEISLDILNDKNFQDWLKDLELTMINKDGAGLAAPQVGKNIRVFAINHDNKNHIIINPKITKKSWAKIKDEEGCLSIVDDKGELLFGKVLRHKKINLQYHDEQGKLHKIKADKFLARVIQHENDHLDGILFIDKMENNK